jgi:hypothetical protein
MSFRVTDGVYIEVNPLGVVLLTTVRPTNKANSGGHDMQLNIANISRPPTVVACAAETNRRAAVWSSAVRLAAAREARLILYDTDASSIWTSPFPEFDAARYQHSLSPAELRELGRVDLASEVDDARAWGVDAYGWLPMTPGAKAMIAYAQAEGADTVVLSRQLEAPSLGQRLAQLTADDVRKEAPLGLTLEFVSGDELWTEASELSSSPVNMVDATATRAVGSALRASRLLTAMGIGLLVAALFLAGGAMWGLLPLPTMVGAIVLGLPGGVMVASARPKAQLVSPLLSVDSLQRETARRVIR